VVMTGQPATPTGGQGGQWPDRLPDVPVHRPVPIGGDPHQPGRTGGGGEVPGGHRPGRRDRHPGRAGPVLVPVDLTGLGGAVASTLDPGSPSRGLRHRLEIARGCRGRPRIRSSRSWPPGVRHPDVRAAGRAGPRLAAARRSIPADTVTLMWSDQTSSRRT
jgi:hypothetical protein